MPQMRVALIERSREKVEEKSERQARRCRMTKLLTTLTLLLHLCFIVQANWDIHLEMKNGLDSLDFLYRQNKSSISFVSIDECVFVFSTLISSVSFNGLSSFS